MKSLTARRVAVIYLVYFLLHLGFDAFARIFQVLPGVSLWYPPVGLALALATILGLRCAPAVLVANLVSALVTSSGPASWIQVALPILITSIYVGTGALVRRYFGPLPAPTQPLRVTGLLGLYLAAPLLAAVVGTLIVVAADGSISVDRFLSIATSWWIGDLTGMLTILPLCLVHVAPRLLQTTRPLRRVRSRRERIELLFQAFALLACLGLMHGFGYFQEYQTYYLCFVPLVWICLRHGLEGATIGVLVLTMGSLAAMKLTGASPLMVTNLLLFEIAVATIGLGLGATVTRRARAEDDRTRLFAILEATPDFIATSDLTGRILYQNAAFLRLRGQVAHGDSERTLNDNHPRWAADKILSEGFPAALANGRWQAETAFLDEKGLEVPVSQVLVAHYDQDREPIMLSTIARDITGEKAAERARLESERNLLQVQKLDSLGVLAGGIAHDFNNLLTVILGNAALARLDSPPDSDAEQSIHQVELAALRAAELCRQMLAYSGRGHLASELVDLTKLVEETANLLQVSIAKKCQLEFALTRNLPPVKGDATQLSQIAMNLVMNASDASSERGGRILIRTGLMEADRAYLAATYLAPTIQPGCFVFLEVSDAGCGMTPEVLARIFEPFFTTKCTGHGLGLSAVLGITRSHHGALKVDSAPERGTTFRLLLPATIGSLPTVASNGTSATWRGEGCVLIVDDEESLRLVAKRLVERLGFTTQSAAHGQEAMDLLRRDQGEFCAVLLDLTMPVMGGEETFRQIQALNPDLPVVLMSGYSESESATRFSGQGLAGFLQKPFDTDRLSQTLRLALNDSATQPA